MADVMQYMDLYSLFVNYVFGNWPFAVLGVMAILIMISIFGKWSPPFRIFFLLLFLIATLSISSPAIVAGVVSLSIGWSAFGMWTLFKGNM